MNNLTRPWAIRENYLQVISSAVKELLNGDEEAAGKRFGEDFQPGYEVSGGVAIISISGIIFKRQSLFRRLFQSGTSILRIQNDLNAALVDKDVSTILLDIDSPGGSVDGVAELADLVYEARSRKEIIAYANGQMASAAYWIGSAASKIYASKTAEVGSIGVYAVVEDWSVHNHNAGIKVDVIKAGRYKAAGHPDRPFTEDDREVIQAEVNEYFNLFVEAVARHRRFSKEQMAAVANGRIFIGQKAASARLVDGIRKVNELVPSRSMKKAAVQTSAKPPLSAGKTTTTAEVIKLTINNVEATAKPQRGEKKMAQEPKAGKPTLEEKCKIEFDTNPSIRREFQRLSTYIAYKRAEAKGLITLTKPVVGGGERKMESAHKASELTFEKKCEIEYNMDPKIRAEFKRLSTYTAYKKAEAQGRVTLTKPVVIG